MNGIYVHIPFCLKKCHYCDFISFENSLDLATLYTDTLLEEMELYRGAEADSLYFGGGTPTALPTALLVKLLNGARDCFCLAPDCEVTAEANPGTCDESSFSLLKEAGVNRISLGVQSFSDAELACLGRIHSAEEAKKAFHAARSAGFQNISLDLMFSLPDQTENSLKESLSELLALGPEHISCYSLTICEETPFGEAQRQGTLNLPDDETDRCFYRLITETLEKNGYERYEISNFAKKGKYSRHNIKYWQRVPYLGLGLGAHSFWENKRFENPGTFSAYLERVKEKLSFEKTELSQKEAMEEAVFLGLRMTKRGLLRQEFFRDFGLELDDVFARPLKKLCGLNLLEDYGPGYRLTERGIDVSNSVFCEFL